MARALAPYLAQPDAGGVRLGAWVDVFRATKSRDEPTVAMLVRLNRHLRDDIDDPEMAAPVSGSTDVCNVTFDASIAVRRAEVPDNAGERALR